MGYTHVWRCALLNNGSKQVVLNTLNHQLISGRVSVRLKYCSHVSCSVDHMINILPGHKDRLKLQWILCPSLTWKGFSKSLVFVPRIQLLKCCFRVFAQATATLLRLSKAVKKLHSLFMYTLYCKMRLGIAQHTDTTLILKS